MTQYTARTLPRFDTRAAWNAILPAQLSGKTLTVATTADFVVIGGGFAGLSAARRVRQFQANAKIAVLDALQIGEGTAGRNSGFMIDLPHDLASDDYAGQGADQDRRLIALNRQAIAFAKTAARDYTINSAYVDAVGKVNGAASAAGDQHNQNYAKHIASLGEPSEMLDAQSMTELTGSTYYRSGLFTPGTMMLQPAGYIRGLANGLRRQNVEIYENTPVTAFTKSGADWIVKTRQGQITAPRIILATNGHLESFGIAKGRLIQLFLYASMTPELGVEHLAKLGGQPRWGITPADPMGTTMRRIDTAQGGNRIITRTCATVRPSMVASCADVTRASKVQQRKFEARFPQLAGLQMQYEWSGHLCLSLNSVSVTGEIEKGVYSACVQNGLGTARGTLTGIAAAEMATGASTQITDFFASEDAPKKLPPQPFAKFGANAYLRWKEWRAGAE